MLASASPPSGITKRVQQRPRIAPKGAVLELERRRTAVPPKREACEREPGDVAPEPALERTIWRGVLRWRAASERRDSPALRLGD